MIGIYQTINLNIHIDSTISSTTILVRAENINYEYSPVEVKVQRYNKNYNLESINDYIQRNNETIYDSVSNTLQKNNIELAVNRFKGRQSPKFAIFFNLQNRISFKNLNEQKKRIKKY